MDVDDKPDVNGSGTKVMQAGTNGVLNEHSSTALWFPCDISGIAPSHLSGDNNLLDTFQLTAAYDRYVRPYLNPAIAGTASRSTPAPPETNGKLGKGADGDAEGNNPNKAKAVRKHYSHIVIDVPGQNKLAKDHHLRDLLADPDPLDHITFIPFDAQALRDAFTLEIGELPDFDTSVWRADSIEDRKKKKKRRLEEAAAINVVTAPSPAATATASANIGQSKKRKHEPT
ncbi:hypothetical protein EMMF5_005832 [Cystobasidiomycetes sp. EMM_F5]